MTTSSTEPGTAGVGTASTASTAGTSRRPTRQRAALAELMAATPEFVSAQELHSKLQSRGDSVGLATVYRNLQAMAADGDVDVVRTDDGECVYRSCATDAHHHHLVCRECGRTVEVEGPAVEKWATEVASRNGFTDVTHTIELFGTCTSH
ncbi:transcriptional repressor [Knoellia sp. S7-12]|uniref:Fur family transcriptional regulator n=1 Tax=Knoellia sp. S7-12 TaxID=3126698 RepID=UPI003367BA4E